MINCKICNREFKSFASLSGHLQGAHKVKSKDYYLKYLGDVGYCYCGAEANFVNMNKGYGLYCSKKCTNDSKDRVEKIVSTKIKKYPKQLEFKLYGGRVSYPAEEADKKRRKTCLEKYGVEHVMEVKEFKDKQLDWMTEERKAERYAYQRILNSRIKNGTSLPLEDRDEWEEYKRTVHHLSSKQPLHLLENSDKLRGMCGVEGAYQLDHIVSIKYGYENNNSAEEIARLENLQFLPWQENLKKGWMK